MREKTTHSIGHRDVRERQRIGPNYERSHHAWFQLSASENRQSGSFESKSTEKCGKSACILAHAYWRSQPETHIYTNMLIQSAANAHFLLLLQYMSDGKIPKILHNCCATKLDEEKNALISFVWSARQPRDLELRIGDCFCSPDQFYASAMGLYSTLYKYCISGGSTNKDERRGTNSLIRNSSSFNTFSRITS